MLVRFRVAQGIYQGPCPRSVEDVRRYGFNVLTFCAREIQPYIPDHVRHDVRVLYSPLNDNPHFPMTDEEWATALQAGREVARITSMGGRALTTCAMGLNRSGIVNAIALHYRFGVSGSQAIEQVRLGRGREALGNPSFVARLRTLPGRLVAAV